MSNPNSTNGVPQWAKTWQRQYTSQVAHAFIFSFNVRDITPTGLGLQEYITKVLAGSQTQDGSPLMDIIVTYDRANGLTFPSASMRQRFMDLLNLTPPEDQGQDDVLNALLGNNRQQTQEPELPRSPSRVLPLLDTLLHQPGIRATVIINHPETLAPNADVSMLSPDDRESMITLAGWGSDPVLAAKGQCVILVTEALSSLNPTLVAASNRYESITVDLPDQAQRLAYIERLRADDEFAGIDWQISPARLANGTAGLGLVHIRDILLRSRQTGALIWELVKERKDSIIASEFADVLEMIEPTYGWERIGGLAHVKGFFQRSVIDPIHAGRYNRVPMGVLMTGPAGCLAKGTPVLMFDGSIRPVELIVPGDLLMGPDSDSRMVLQLYRGKEMMYRVTPNKGDPYTVNESHILSLKMSYNASWKKKGEIVNISVRDYLNQSRTFKWSAKGWRTGISFHEQALPIEPYILGLWLGDGSSAWPRITTPDQEVVDAISTYSADNGLYLSTQTKPGNMATDYNFAMQSNAGKAGGYNQNWMLNVLRGLNLINNKHIPEMYQFNSRQNRLELLAGLLDTDGSLSCGGYEISSKYDLLADGIMYLARGLGFAATDRIKWVNGNPYHRIFISGDVDEIPMRIERKKAGPRQQIKDVLVTGIKVDPVGVDDYYGFELDGDHLFMLGDFTVTHNTGKSAVAIAVAKEAGINAVSLNMSRILGQYVGNSERNLEKAIQAIQSLSPTIVFIDEIDQTVSRSEGGDSGVGSRIFKRLLEFMSDTRHRGRVVFLAATNRPDLMDAALRRPGRFDKKIPFLVPDEEERANIIQVMARIYGLGDLLTVSPSLLAASDGWTGAEIEAAAVKAVELVEDEDLAPEPALAEAFSRLSPSTADIQFMTLLAIRETNDTDLLPTKYRQLLANRTALDKQIEQSRSGTDRSLNLL